MIFFFFFFNDTATTEIYTLSLHDALPISKFKMLGVAALAMVAGASTLLGADRNQEQRGQFADRSEEHTSELQSPCNLVCRLLLEKKKKKKYTKSRPHQNAHPPSANPSQSH